MKYFQPDLPQIIKLRYQLHLRNINTITKIILLINNMKLWLHNIHENLRKENTKQTQTFRMICEGKHF